MEIEEKQDTAPENQCLGKIDSIISRLQVRVQNLQDERNADKIDGTSRDDKKSRNCKENLLHHSKINP